MIALVTTILVALYVLGPDLFSRWIMSFVMPRKNLAQTKSEEITRGIVWSLGPFWIAWMVRHIGPWPIPQGLSVSFKDLFGGLYSDAYFQAHKEQFFTAATTFVNANICLLTRLYFVVAIFSIILDLLIKYYGVIRNWLPARGFWWFLRPTFAVLVLPRVSEWHVILSDVLLPSRQMKIEADVLTKSGIMYSGTLDDKCLNLNGEIQSLTLEKPRRFRREHYLEAIKSDPETDAAKYWKDIPGKIFVVVGSEIATLNIQHIPIEMRRYNEEFKDISEQLKVLSLKVQALQQKR